MGLFISAPFVISPYDVPVTSASSKEPKEKGPIRRWARPSVLPCVMGRAGLFCLRAPSCWLTSDTKCPSHFPLISIFRGRVSSCLNGLSYTSQPQRNGELFTESASLGQTLFNTCLVTITWEEHTRETCAKSTMPTHCSTAMHDGAVGTHVLTTGGNVCYQGV